MPSPPTSAAVPPLEDLLAAPIAPPAPDVLDALRDPIREAEALPLSEIDRLRDPTPLARENGWCWTRDRVAYVAVRTPLPGHSAEMWDWWFDWHPRDPLRYRVWYPSGHFGTRFVPAAQPGAKRLWGTTHFPDEDVGVGRDTVRIDFLPPSEYGFSTDALDDPRVATIVGGYAGSASRRMRAGVMTHVFLREGDGLVLRSRFWLGACLRPYLPGALGDGFGLIVNRPLVRRLALPTGLPRALADHCAREYARLGALLPELFRMYA
jgi:hypothetical protein